MRDTGDGEVALSWLMVSHDSAPDLATLLPQLVDELAALADRGVGSELIVADNASADASADLTRHLAPRATVLGLPRNVGYGTALNRAADGARGRWFAYSNADLALAAGDLSALPDVLRSLPREVGLFGPALRDGEGRWQPSAGSFPTLRRLLQHLPRRAAARPYLSRAAHREGRVDWVTGACVFIRADLFRKLGGFDEHYFLYYEDVDLAARALQLGWTTHYAPRLRAAHLRPHAGRSREPATEAFVRHGRARWFSRHRPEAEQRLLGLLARVEPVLRGRARGADRA
jgi:N-acetylglucosaminyl-diphospho-decaprenol L-rhamnosyltransferase